MIFMKDLQLHNNEAASFFLIFFGRLRFFSYLCRVIH